MNRLDAAAAAVGEALETSLGDLAQKVSGCFPPIFPPRSSSFPLQVEVNLSVLWEGVRDDPAQVRARKFVVDMVSEVQNQLRLWTEAARFKKGHQDEDGDVEMPAA